MPIAIGKPVLPSQATPVFLIEQVHLFSLTKKSVMPIIETGVIGVLYQFRFNHKSFPIPFKLTLKITKSSLAPRFKIQFDFLKFLYNMIHWGPMDLQLPISLNDIMGFLIMHPRMLIFKVHALFGLMSWIRVQQDKSMIRASKWSIRD